MIKIDILKNLDGDVFSFKVQNHGNPLVCSAVSILSQNCVNSIEVLTELKENDYVLDFKEEGFIYFSIIKNKISTNNKDAALLLNSFFLGISEIFNAYPNEIKLNEKIKLEKIKNQFKLKK
ncbi:MAG: ribosomal-processing cysteine protease Prp [Defluviitaleaceae bacterium]|nr:ribosomal-processing cysteine protease Prp [Defluviitaleaceae bacterium]